MSECSSNVKHPQSSPPPGLCAAAQVKVWSAKELKVMVVKDEEELEELEHFSFWSMVQHWMHEKTNETTVSISLFSQKTCFRVDPSDHFVSYTVKSSRSESDVLVRILCHTHPIVHSTT